LPPSTARGKIAAKRTGSKVIRVIMRDGQPTGEYEDFATGFVVNDASGVGARPVGVTVTPGWRPLCLG